MEATCSSSPISSLALPRSFRSSASHRRLFAAGPPPSSRLTTSSSLMINLDLDLHRRFAPLFLPSHRRRQPRKPVSALLERFNERAVAVVVFSQREARALGSAVVHNPHLLLGLIAEDASADGFLDSGVTIDRARDAVLAWWTESSTSKPAPPSAAADVPFSAGTKRVLQTAAEYCSSIGCKSIGPELIAISLFKVDDGGAAKVLKSLGADLNQLIMVAFSRLQAKLKSENMQSSTASYKIEQKPPAGKLARSLEKTKDKSMITQFCVDLTSRAKEGLIDPVIGRDREIQRIIQIICRRTKNNPILLGDAGVGKTAIAEGLALLIASGEVPSFLAAKRILSLDVGLLIAGTKERGELEARVTGLIHEVRKSGDIILFIDEVHTLIGSGIAGRGNKSSGLDIANLLKPSLSRGALQCIASTTLEEHKIHFEKDKAFARRFQPVFIAEPSQEDTVRILLGLREKYEMFHKCRFTLEAINAAVKLSARYIPDRHLPDKAIDLIDEAGSRARMDAFKRRKEQQISVLYKSPEEYWQDIRAVHVKHEVESKNKMKYSSDDRISDNFKIVNDEKVSSTAFSMNYEQVIVGAEEIAKVASLWSGIPVQKLNEDDRKLLVGLEEELKKRVIGQDEAVTAISQAVKRSRVGLNDPHRPISVMLFCGPTGVGKSELAKALTACYFGSEESMLRLDMSEYMERHTVSKLIGSPPGYLGYGEGGTLTDAVRSNPFTLILLDEIEKAHSDIFNILLQVFEDGQLTDSQGRKVSFKNTLIVMTSNIGSEAISKGKRRVGFFTAEDRQSNSYAAMKAVVTQELKAYFLPELLNRIDEVVFFRSLQKPQMREILNIMLEQVKKRLASLRLSLEVTDAMKDVICQEGFDRIYGARPLRRAVTHLIEDVLSETILARNYQHGDTLVIDVDATGNPFVTRQPDQTIHFLDNKSSPL
ncbi:chaperone protein ClpD2, chloroplastic-like [Zingiber officinale]|uniref:chaperone protein ClpD2, chloroplastic-like n=1 Tax=Zingiber officinale TaxID=94328 RepID=UPI001C4B55B3|nr:chaperone protein ClpD2, chloroplastic-like [Zingiber officinale]